MTSKPTPHLHRAVALGSSANSIPAASSPAASAANRHAPAVEAGQNGAGISKPASKRLHRKKAADYIGTSLSWLDKSRLRGDGPVYLQIGGRIIYDTADLDDFLARCRRRSTSQGP